MEFEVLFKNNLRRMNKYNFKTEYCVACQMTQTLFYTTDLKRLFIDMFRQLDVSEMDYLLYNHDIVTEKNINEIIDAILKKGYHKSLIDIFIIEFIEILYKLDCVNYEYQELIKKYLPQGSCYLEHVRMIDWIVSHRMPLFNFLKLKYKVIIALEQK